MDRIGTLKEILAQNPTDSFARYGLAMAFDHDGRVDDALDEYRTITEHDADYVPAYQMSAQLLLRADRPEDARARLMDGLAAAARTGNAHAASELQAMLDDLAL